MARLPLTLIALLTASLFGAGPPVPGRVVPAVERELLSLLAGDLAAARAATLKELAHSEAVPGLFKTAVARHALRDPLAGLAELEGHALGVAAAAERGLAGLPGLLTRLARSVDHPAGPDVAVPPGRLDTLDDHAAHVVRVLDRAAALRDEALKKLTPAQRAALFTDAARLATAFRPQARLGPRNRDALDRRAAGPGR